MTFGSPKGGSAAVVAAPLAAGALAGRVAAHTGEK
jgi:hypothetical protein